MTRNLLEVEAGMGINLTIERKLEKGTIAMNITAISLPGRFTERIKLKKQQQDAGILGALMISISGYAHTKYTQKMTTMHTLQRERLM